MRRPDDRPDDAFSWTAKFREIASDAELPTWAVAIAVYGGWLLLTWYFHRLPAWVVALAGGYLLAWHNSLQHETIHGHPTGRRRIDAAIGWPPLGLLVPYPLYRRSHLAHHAAGDALADPARDPESFYVAPEAWARLPRPLRALHRLNATLLGRLLIGPAVVAVRFLAGELRALAAGDRARARAWLLHAAAVALVLGWVVGVCRISPWAYLALFVYPGMALTLLRSFAEHWPTGTAEQRTAVVETNPLVALLYLNNNLHVVHHAAPALPWFALPARWRARRRASAGPVFRGYRELARRFGLRPKDTPVYAGGSARESSPALTSASTAAMSSPSTRSSIQVGTDLRSAA